jgi:predicted acyltransferase
MKPAMLDVLAGFFVPIYLKAQPVSPNAETSII